MKERDLIWVNKDLAEQYKELDTDFKKVELVNKIIADKKLDITNDIQNLDDDLLRFKAFALNYSTAFKKTYEDQSEKLFKIWEDCSEPINKIDAKTMSIRKDIIGISKDIDGLAKQLETLNTYKLERLIELIQTYNNMSDNDKDVFKVILNRE